MKPREVAIVGVGLHPWGAFPQKSIPDMAVVAISQALENAHMSWREVETVASGAYMWISGTGGIPALLSGTSIVNLMGETGIPIVSVVNACATGQSVLREAYLAVASGEHDVALAVASDKSAGGFFRPQSQDGKFDVDYMRYVMTGETNPAYWAMECKRRMHDVGTTEEDLALVKVVTSKAGVHNPNARYRKAFTMEEVLNSPMVCDPLRLYEICATSDGAAAMLLVPLDQAHKYTKKPVLLEAITVGTTSYGEPTIRLTHLSTFPRPGVPHLSESRRSIANIYKRANRKPEDIDIIELPDNSSWHYFAYLDGILQLEAGGAERLLRNGDTDPLTGKIPVCAGGGLGASGEAVVAQGLAQVYELVIQLRGEGGARQVKKDARVGLAQTYGYAGNNAACIVSRAW
ncbi:MAG: lipid-transfer protein [Chloroflexi bacterium]|nr:lipid-transfer protein [Chloroflexota bacterium]